MRDWAAKIRIKVLYYVAKLLEVRPFLEIDPNQYCPACGQRDGKIVTVALAAADQDGSKAGVLHRCNICTYEFIEPTVTIVKQHLMTNILSEEELNMREMEADKRTKNIRTFNVKVGAR